MSILWRAFSRLYVTAFARPGMQGINEALLRLAMRGRGYDNCCSPEQTGEAKFHRFLAELKPELCIDVGANVGKYSLSLLNRTNASIVAFEPLPMAFERLRTLAQSYPERLQPLNLGVGSENAELELRFGARTELASFSTDLNDLDYVSSSNTESCKVQVVTLDTFFEANSELFEGRSLDLLKIDTEGFEHEVLVGARRTIAERMPKCIQIEFNWHQLFRGHSIYAFSKLLPGYRCVQLLPHGTGLMSIDPKSPTSNIPTYSNFVFIRQDIVLPR